MAVLLLDFFPGCNASMDLVGELLDAILEAKRATARRGGKIGNLQDLKLQTNLLEEAGAIILTTNAKTASFCVELLN